MRDGIEHRVEFLELQGKSHEARLAVAESNYKHMTHVVLKIEEELQSQKAQQKIEFASIQEKLIAQNAKLDQLIEAMREKVVGVG